MIVAGTFFGNNDPRAIVASSLIVCFFLFMVTVRWASVKEPSPYSLHRNGWATPALPPFVNMWRAYSFGVGIIGGFVALVAYYYPASLAGDAKFALLGALVALSLIPAVMFTRMWRSVAKVMDENKTLLLEKEVMEKFMEMKGLMRPDHSPPPLSSSSSTRDHKQAGDDLDAAVAKLPVSVVAQNKPEVVAVEMTGFDSDMHKFQPTSGGEYDSVATPPPLRADMSYKIYAGHDGFECRIAHSSS